MSDLVERLLKRVNQIGPGSHATYLDAELMRSSALRIERLSRLLAVTDWFGGQHALELSHKHPTYGDDDLDERWQVHRRNGSINDREWELVGEGDTPLAAMEAARTALEAKERS